MSTKKLPAKKCRATNRQGKQCGRWAIPGGTVCNLHGGKTPAVQRAAARRYREQQIQAELERHKELTATALTGVTNPLDELQRLTTEARFFMDSLKTRVNELKTIKTYDDKGAEQAAVEIDLYLKSMDRLTKLLDIALKHDIEGRKLALDQAKADMVAGLIIRTLANAGLTGDRMEEAKAYMLTEIQKLEAEEKQ